MQLSQAKRQYLGQAFISWDIPQNRILNMGKQMLLQDKIYDPEDLSLIIGQISAKQLQEIAMEYFIPDRFNTLLYYPDF